MSSPALPIQTQAPKWAVQAPDGKVIQFPDEFTDADVTREMSKMYGAPQGADQQSPQIPEDYGFTGSNLGSQAWQGVKELGQGLYGLGKDILFPQGNTEGQRLSFLANKYVMDPANAEMRKAQTAATPMESVGHSVAAALPFIGPWAASLGEQAGTGDVGGALARGTTQAGVTELAKPIAGKVASKIPSKGDIGLAFRTEGGALKPIVRQTGGLTGAALGHASGVPVLGPLIGYGLGENLANAIIPDRPFDIPAKVNPGAPLPAAEDFYANKGAELLRRGREQAILDRQAARNAPQPFQPSPFSGMTLSAGPGLPKGNPTPFSGLSPSAETSTAPVRPTFLQKFESAIKPKIVSPESEPPPSRVTYQSVPQPDLLRMVKAGDRAAIGEWQRRGLQLPENVGFMVESGAGTLPWRRYRR